MFVFPEFVVPKKNTEEVRFASDFRELNKNVQRSPCLVPLTRDALNKIECFKQATTIDTSMGHWHASLDIEFQLKCVITTPWGRRAYTRLPIGLSSRADMFQEIISWLVQELENLFVCAEDLLITTSGSYDEYLK